VGGTEDIKRDFRVMASSNRDLKREIAAQRFREGLYLRLNIMAWQVPMLRNRVEDIAPLSKQFMAKYGMELNKDVKEIDSTAIAVLERYSFPGNVRELHNIIERAVILCKGTILTAGDLPSELRDLPAPVTVAQDNVYS
ncbi:MAG: sigma 54-interacting transcriptional regulator, partial [Nitrospirae bacterium]|nr:sigma 54-interacting transcriptional regulator [Nitrospirota bacterium]